ncbi:hypothetical protein HAX54_003216, partial [Datura stramonium]|nr:hypothetical protein [Datura stramonium]
KETMISSGVTVGGSDVPSDYHMAPRTTENYSHMIGSAQLAVATKLKDEEVHKIFDPRGDRVIAAFVETWTFQMSKLPDETPKSQMKPIEERDSQENLSARIHAMMEWRCRQVRMDFTT